MKLLFLAMLVEATLFAPLPRQGSVLSEDQLRGRDDIGTCSGRAGDVDLRRIMFLENTALIIEGPDGPLEISYERENVIVTELAPESDKREFFSSIDHMVSPKEDLDLELKLGHDGHQLLVYWRETFKNRIYRQGLLKVDASQLFKPSGSALTVMCEGRGGRRTEP